MQLRIPFIIAANHFLSEENATNSVIALSGICEELVRLGAIYIVNHGNSFSSHYSIGIGWGFIEVLYSIIQAFALLSLHKKQDEESIKAKQKLENILGKLYSFPSSYFFHPIFFLVLVHIRLIEHLI